MIVYKKSPIFVQMTREPLIEYVRRMRYSSEVDPRDDGSDVDIGGFRKLPDLQSLVFRIAVTSMLSVFCRFSSHVLGF